MFDFIFIILIKHFFTLYYKLIFFNLDDKRELWKLCFDITSSWFGNVLVNMYVKYSLPISTNKDVSFI